MKRYAIIVAGGTGNRMKGDVPKQFMLLNEKPVIFYSIEAFLAFDPSIKLIIVIHPDYIPYWQQLLVEHAFKIPHQITSGGSSRFESVKKGLALIGEDAFVAIHDAARPIINSNFISRLFSVAESFGSALPAIPLTETIRSIEGDTTHQLDRTMLRVIQTPQVFKSSELHQAYTQPYHPIFTDDASVIQSAGYSLHLTEGQLGNIKITYLQDFALAEVLIKLL